MTIPIIGEKKNEEQNFLQCPKCNNVIFDTVQMFQIVSPIQTRTGKPGLVPIPIIRCLGCGYLFMNNESKKEGS